MNLKTRALSTQIEYYQEIWNIPKSKFRKLQVENTTIIAHGINKNPRSSTSKYKKPKINKINFENRDNALKLF